MIFRNYISELQVQGYAALRIADFWQRKIARDGEDNAEAFYRHLGLNHIEKKGIQWEGLTLSREPKEHEKVAVKGIAGAQESAFESISKILLKLRTELISDGLKVLPDFSPKNYHKLTLSVSSENRLDLRDRLIKVHQRGRMLVVAELGDSKSAAWPALYGTPSQTEVRGRARAGALFKRGPEDEFDELDLLTDVTDARILNDVQARITAAATRYSLLGLTGDELIEAVNNEVSNGSVAYIDRASRGLANKVIALGRSDEAEARSDEWERVEYSALLDQNVCGPCAAEDGKSAQNEDDLEPAPNPDCLGGDFCRCFHVWITE